MPEVILDAKSVEPIDKSDLRSKVSHATAASEPTADLFLRAQMAIVGAAVAIAAEDPATSGHAERAGLARQALMNPSGVTGAMIFGLASQGITAASDDATVSNAVAALWNAYAGA